MSSQRQDFFSMYFSYTEDTEVPAFFHRWSVIAGLGAYLGRDFSFSHGHFNLYPNAYVMLIGSPGTRKSTAIKLIRSLISKTGYNTFAADKTTKEKFLLDLVGDTDFTDEKSIDSINLFGDNCDTATKEMFIAADEFNDFVGLGNIEFISLLGTLWDYSGVYTNRIKTGKSVSIYNPTISILGGNTPTGFSLAFPTEILGQGFFSRLLLVYGEPTGKKITFPRAPGEGATNEILTALNHIKVNSVGIAELSKSAERLLDKIYKSWEPLEDVRFASYSNRRFTHLLKLCLVVTAARFSKQITESDVVYANTILSHTELLMPKALGEFGKARNSDVVHKVVQIIESSFGIVTIKDIYAQLIQDLESIAILTDIMRGLVIAERIQAVKGGFLPRRKLVVEVSTDTVDYSLLTAEEIKK